MPKRKTIVLGVTGGIAAYKAAELTRRLIEADYEVHVMMTKAAREFVTPLTFQVLSGHPVHTDLFNLTEEREMSHISLARKADLVVVAPATANTLAKVAHGICDDIVTTVICATQAPTLFAPSMNRSMWKNPITQENIAKLRRHKYLVLEPDEGFLACGEKGKGRLPEPETLLREIEKALRVR